MWNKTSFENNSLVWALIISILILLFFPVPASSEPTGTISGLIVHKYLTGKKPSEPMQNIKIVLCRVPDDKSLPDGSFASTTNEGKLEAICALQEEPTAVTNSEGRYMLTKVPLGRYLLLFHLLPSELKTVGTGWNGIVVTEAVLSESDESKIFASGKSDFWEKGGITAAFANWSSEGGFTLTKGTVCSDLLGFCFSLRDKKAHPIIEVQPDSTIEVELQTYIRPRKKD